MILSKVQNQHKTLRTGIPRAIIKTLGITAGDILLWVPTKNGGVTLVRVTAALQAAQRATVPA